MTGTAVATLISAFGLYLIAFWLYRDYQVDRFREGMFALRGQLFDFAASGAVSFEHPAYRMLRQLMNNHIRFGHRVRILPAAIFYRSLTEEEKQWLLDHSFDMWWRDATNDLDVPAARTLEAFKERATHQFQTHLILGSPTLAFTVIPAVALIVAAWFPLEIAKRILARMTATFEMASGSTGGASGRVHAT